MGASRSLLVNKDNSIAVVDGKASSTVIAGLDPAIQLTAKGWMPGSSPGMTAVYAAASAPRSLHQPALLDRGADERREQRVRLERPRFQLGMILHADEP